MNKFIIQIVISLLLSSVQAMSVYRSDGTQSKGDEFDDFGRCDGTTAYGSDGKCTCNEVTTFYMDDKNKKPRCYGDDYVRNITACDLRLLTEEKNEFPVEASVKNITSIKVWDAKYKRGFWNSEWKNELKKFITKEGNNKIKVEKKNANFEGLLIRIAIELLPVPDRQLAVCVIIKVKGRKSYPLKWESIFPSTTAPSTTADTTTTTTTTTTATTTIKSTNVQRTKVLSTKIKTPPVAKENTTSNPLNSEASTSTPLIVGIVLTVLVLLLLVFIFCFIRRKRLKKQKHKRMELQNNQPIYQEYDVSLREIDAKQEDEDAHNEYAYTYNSTTDMLKTKTPTSENNDYGYAYNNPKDLKPPPENSDLQESNYYSPVISDEQAEQLKTEIPEYAAVNKERK